MQSKPYSLRQASHAAGGLAPVVATRVVTADAEDEAWYAGCAGVGARQRGIELSLAGRRSVGREEAERRDRGGVDPAVTALA